MSGYSLSFWKFLFFLEFYLVCGLVCYFWARIHEDTLDMILAFRLDLRLANDLFLSQLDTYILTHIPILRYTTPSWLI